jgi:hypothetical protein
VESAVFRAFKCRLNKIERQKFQVVKSTCFSSQALGVKTSTKINTRRLHMNYMDGLKLLSPGSYLIAKAVEKSVETFSDNTKNDTLKELREEEIRQNIKSRVLQEQARTEQELAIARRIDNAENVEIEEYYDLSGKASAGLNTNGENISVGLSGEGRRVSKRIYKFKGLKPINQTFISVGDS